MYIGMVHQVELECGALGLPVLASDHSVYRKLESAPHVRFVQHGFEHWTEALRHQISIGRAGGNELREWIFENYDLDSSLAAFDKMLLEIIEEPLSNSDKRFLPTY